MLFFAALQVKRATPHWTASSLASRLLRRRCHFSSNLDIALSQMISSGKYLIIYHSFTYPIIVSNSRKQHEKAAALTGVFFNPVYRIDSCARYALLKYTCQSRCLEYLTGFPFLLVSLSFSISKPQKSSLYETTKAI